MADGGSLQGAVAGTGRTAVVFLHETGGQGMCGFATYAQWLAGHDHVQVLLVDRCGYGETACKSAADSHDIRRETQPAVDWARAHGARTVALVGASSGGLDALEAAATVHGANSLVDISGDENDTGANDLQLARRVTVPAYFAVAPGDEYVSVAATRRFYNAVRSRVRRLDIEKGSPGVHGWDLLTTPAGRPSVLASEIAHWVLHPSR